MDRLADFLSSPSSILDRKESTEVSLELPTGRLFCWSS